MLLTLDLLQAPSRRTPLTNSQGKDSTAWGLQKRHLHKPECGQIKLLLPTFTIKNVDFSLTFLTRFHLGTKSGQAVCERTEDLGP